MELFIIYKLTLVYKHHSYSLT